MMESTDLLAREEEFKKLNKQLEIKTAKLINEIETVMQKPDIFSEFSSSIDKPRIVKYHNCNTPPKPPPAETKDNKSKNTNVNNKQVDNEKLKQDIKCDCCKVYNPDEFEFLRAFINVNVKDNVLPQSFLKENISLENVCKFLSSKIKLMEEQITKLQNVIDTKVAQCDVHLRNTAELEADRLKMLNDTNNARAQATDLKSKVQLLQTKLTEKEKQYKEQRSEADKFSNEVKRLRAKNATAEARCISYEEDIVRLKQQLDNMKTSEKEFRESSRSHSASQKTAISQLESKIKVLNSVIEKQKLLVENLREQNSLLSTSVMMEGLEKEYSKLLLSGQ